MKPITALGKLFFNIMLTFAITFAVASGAALFVDVNPLLAATALTGANVVVESASLSFGLDRFKNAAFMAIQREIWQKEIVEEVFKGNEFLNFAVNADEYVLQGRVVHIPNASGTRPGVKINRSLLPATVTQRVDTDVTYTLDELTTDPIHIPDADQVELSYNKRQSVMADTYETIRDTAGDLMLHKWAPTTSDDANTIIRTTGDTIATYLPGATGNRKTIKVADIIAAEAIFNKQRVPKSDRYIILPTELMSQLKAQLSVNQERDFASGQDVANGIIGKMYSFNFIERSDVLLYVNGTPTTLKAFGAAGAANDCAAALCWQKNCVERAMGDVKFFEDLANPQFYGDIYSSLLRMGGRKRRADKKGVLAIVEAVV